MIENKKIIVTTTINQPTEATLKYCKIASEKKWIFIIVGDNKTPHDDYKKLENNNVLYLDAKIQEDKYPLLSETIGWNSIQRRNIGFVYAYEIGGDIIATVDDDNIPYDNWGDNILVGSKISIDTYENISCPYFDPLSVTEHNDLWHRGYPIDFLNVKNNVNFLGKSVCEVLVQSDFWDGDPDIDAICRLSKKPIIKFNPFNPFGSTQISPFNSQNTFLHRKILPYYAVLPHIGRMDDIWGSYIMQSFFPNSVIYNEPTVYQKRNEQDLISNLEKEILGYRQTLKLLNNLENFYDFLPKETQKFWDVYTKSFKK